MDLWAAVARPPAAVSPFSEINARSRWHGPGRPPRLRGVILPRVATEKRTARLSLPAETFPARCGGTTQVAARARTLNALPERHTARPTSRASLPHQVRPDRFGRIFSPALWPPRSRQTRRARCVSGPTESLLSRPPTAGPQLPLGSVPDPQLPPPSLPHTHTCSLSGNRCGLRSGDQRRR